MVAWTVTGPRRLAAAFVALCVCSGVVACATSSPPQDAGPEASASGGAESLSDVWVERAGEGSRLTLVGLGDPERTAFLYEDPDVLVVDLVDTDLARPADPQAIYDGLVEQVSVSTYSAGDEAPMTRVEVTLSAPVDYRFESGEQGLALVLSPLSPAGPAAPAEGGDEDLAGSDEDDPWADPALESVAAVEAAESTPEEGEARAPRVDPDPATKLASVDVQSLEQGVLLHLLADGIIGAAASFTLEDPDRLVLDLPGLQSEVTSNRIDVGHPALRRVRIGAHADKIRVVLDAGDAADGFEGRRVVPAADGLLVSVGSGSDLEAALARALEGAERALPVAAAPAEPSEESVELSEAEEPQVVESAGAEEADLRAPEAEPTPVLPEAVLATVHGIHFDSQPERDRIVVLSEGLIDYRTYSPDEESLVLVLSDARIPREAEGRITPPPGGPVSLITAFQQPETESLEVRIVVKRARSLEPEISRRGEILFIDFPNTGAVAAAPPAFPGTATVLSTGEAPAPQPGITVVAADTASLAAPGEAGTGGQAGPSPAEAMSAEEAYGSLSGQPAGMDGVAQAGGAAGDSFGPPAAAAPGLDDPSTAGLEPLVGGGPAALEPPAAVDVLEEGGLIDGKEYRGRRISLDFKDVEIADVLRIIAEVSDLNIVAGEEVTGKVTIRLVDVPWDQALDVILLTKGLGFVRVGNVLRIAPADILAQEEEIRLQERRNKEKLEDLVVKLQPVNYASEGDVSDLVTRLLSARGTVNVDQRTNTLIIKDIGSVVDEAVALINAIDTQTPQVMIEAKIVEANLDFSRELGSVWSVGTNPLVDGFGGSDEPRRDLGGEDFLFHDDNSVVFANPITSLASGLLSLNAFILDEQIDLGVSIAAAESSGDGKVISSPRIVTLDNREAEIEQGVSIPFQTFENGDARLEFIDAVLRLRVTPHITADRSIIMLLEVERNAPDDTVPTPTGSPAIAKNEARTETLVKDGQTLVIGGIYTVTKSTRESRVPYLASIPIIGNAFRSREVTDARKELLIFVTPRVVVQPATS